MSSTVDRSAAITEAMANYEKFSAKIEADLARATALLTKVPEGLSPNPQIERVLLDPALSEAAGGRQDMVLSLCERTAAALAAYRAQEWDAAERLFREYLAIESAGQPARLFLERIAAFRVSPPTAEWNGAWVFDVK